jgi:hypothetical protein
VCKANAFRLAVPDRATPTNETAVSAGRFSAGVDVAESTLRTGLPEAQSKCNESLRSRLSSKK